MTVLRISEVFGPTLQGEGRSTGRPCHFIRLSLCNLDCRWCDTPFTWDWTGKNGVAYDKSKEVKTVELTDLEEMIPLGCQRVVITGGEPLVQMTALEELVPRLIERGIRVEIETNGTILPSDVLAGAGFNISPKLTNSGVAPSKALKFDILHAMTTFDCIYKFVVQGQSCLDEVDEIVDKASHDPSTVYLMPEGTDQPTILSRLPWLFDHCAVTGYNLSPRLHVLAHGNKRGI